MKSLADEKNTDRIANVFILLAAGAVLIPFLVLGDEYIFTPHDYLDSYPGYMRIVRKLPLIPDFDANSGVMNDMPAFYFCPEFNLYRFINHYFEFVFAEFLNRAVSIGIGFFSAKYLLTQIFDRDCLPYSAAVVIAMTYAVSPVYPAWSIGFAVLPLLMAKLVQYWRAPDTKITWHIVFFLFAGLFGSFACLGMFVCFIWFLAILAFGIKYQKVNKIMLAALILMSVGYVITNVYLFMMVFSGVETSRLLIKPKEWIFGFDGICLIFQGFLNALIHGQYHAAPILNVIVPFCAIGGINFFMLYRRRGLKQEESLLVKRLLMLFFGICAVALVYGLESAKVLKKIFANVLPLLVGFNFSRLLYLNNILWYILFTGVIALFIMHYRKKYIALAIVLFQLIAVLSADGMYQNTKKNVLHPYYAKRSITYRQFLDREFWEKVKDKIQYQNEKVVCVGYHPSVLIANDFNTMDGYLSLHPLKHHEQFRKIIAPTLDMYPPIKEYYDGWGGRMYVYADSKDNTYFFKGASIESKALHINVEEFKNQGGKYVFSRFILSNAADIHLQMICECDSTGGAYHILVYRVV